MRRILLTTTLGLILAPWAAPVQAAQDRTGRLDRPANFVRIDDDDWDDYRDWQRRQEKRAREYYKDLDKRRRKAAEEHRERLEDYYEDLREAREDYYEDLRDRRRDAERAWRRHGGLVPVAPPIFAPGYNAPPIYAPGFEPRVYPPRYAPRVYPPGPYYAPY